MTSRNSPTTERKNVHMLENPEYQLVTPPPRYLPTMKAVFILSVPPYRLANSSATRNPALCRVNLNCSPGLPRPTTSKLLPRGGARGFGVFASRFLGVLRATGGAADWGSPNPTPLAVLLVSPGTPVLAPCGGKRGETAGRWRVL